jgi:hypothetical protein
MFMVLMNYPDLAPAARASPHCDGDELPATNPGLPNAPWERRTLCFLPLLRV